MENFSNINLYSIRKFGLARADCCRLIRIVTGYALTNKFLHRIGAKESPECECGSATQDLDHVLWACSRFNSQRIVFFDLLAGENLFPPFSTYYLIAVLNDKVAKYLTKFLNASSLKL